MLPEIQRSGSADIIEKLLVRWIRNAQLFMQLIHQSGSLFHDIVLRCTKLTANQYASLGQASGEFIQHV